jgi:hypothetical protein
MKHAMATTTSRRGWLSRLLLAAAMAPVMGTMVVPIPEVDAKKIQPIKKRVQNAREACEIVGGTATVEKRPGGTTVTCSDGFVCTISSKKTRCFQTLTNSPATNAGGGGAVPPDDNGNEDPSDGGADPGGGGGVDPGWEADPGGGGSDPVLE